MQLDPNDTIGGLPILKVRDFMREWEDGWDISKLVAAFRISQDKAEQVVHELLHRGDIERDEAASEAHSYKLTTKGAAFRLAKGSPPLTRKTAERKLSEFMDRVREANSNRNFAYRVRKVVVFGSYLTSNDKLGDIDVAVELAPREQDHVKQQALNNARIFSAESTGRRFNNILDRLYWAQHEVCLFLKSRSRAISLHRTDDEAVFRDRFKVLHEEP
jgi:predicted transcriptional regulator/predicted nucleotidyltransferase